MLWLERKQCMSKQKQSGESCTARLLMIKKIQLQRLERALTLKAYFWERGEKRECLPLKRRNVLLNKTTKIKFERVRVWESMCERVREGEREWYQISTEISALIGEERRKRKKSFKKGSEWCNFDVTSALGQSACERVCVCVRACVGSQHYRAHKLLQHSSLYIFVYDIKKIAARL